MSSIIIFLTCIIDFRLDSIQALVVDDELKKTKLGFLYDSRLEPDPIFVPDHMPISSNSSRNLTKFEAEIRNAKSWMTCSISKFWNMKLFDFDIADKIKLLFYKTWVIKKSDVRFN